MSCTHEKVRCTDGIFYCLTCGQRINYPPAEEETTPKAENKPEKTAVKGVKRKKKEGNE